MAGARRVKIRYYAALKKRVSDPAWPGGNIPLNWLRDGAPKRYDRGENKMVDADVPGIANLTYGAGGTAYLRDPSALDDDPDPDFHFAEMVQETTDFMHLRLWRVRRSQLPSLHDLADGSTGPLGLLDTQGLAEAVDLVLLHQACVAGLLVNRAGPSRANILSYLEDRTAVPMRLVPLARDDALDIVNGDRVAAVDVEVVAGHFQAIANINEEIGKAAKKLDTPGLRTMRVALAAKPDERGRFWQWWVPRARRIVGLPKEDVKRLEVSQTASGELAAHVINLLEEQIGLEVSVPVETGRTVEVLEGRRAILNGYDAYNELIRRAADGLDAHTENQRTERKKRQSEGTNTLES